MNGHANGGAIQLVDATAVSESLRVLLPAGAVTELRALDATTPADNWPHTASGYFDDPDKLTAALTGLRSAKGIYLIPNAVAPALLSRAANRLRKTPKGESTADNNIDRRRWLLIDCDPQRPSGISSTDGEHQAALQRAQAVELHLHDLGWLDPIFADSGNGAHLLYRVDLPVDDGGLIKRVLQSLAKQFDDDAVKIDTSVFNPARIWKLYGTLTCKGDSTPDRPHRMSRILQLPETEQIVTREQLEELAGPEPSPDLAPTHRNRDGHIASGDPFDVAAFISRYSLDVDGPLPWSGAQGSGQRWTFNASPMCDHNDDGPYIVQHASGAVTAGCHHNSCSWGWADLREVLEPRTPRHYSQGEQVFDGGDRYVPASQVTSTQAERHQVQYKIITSAELATGDYTIEFDIEETMVTGDPLIVAGPQKVLKTSVLIDAAISLANCGFFLGKLHVTRSRRVAVMTGESGLRVIQETANRICEAAGVKLADLENLIWSTDLPKFGDAAHLRALEQFLTDNRIEVLVIDPAYMALPGADAGNLMMHGELLRGVNDVCRACSTTLMLAHHTVKASGRDNLEPLQLHDLAWAGFSEFAAQWWLINRRERYEPGTGEHRLWLTVGGRAGHSTLWALDVNEGLRTDPGGRRWSVDLQPASEARDAAQHRKAQAKAQLATEQLEQDRKSVCQVLVKHPNGMTITAIRDGVGISGRRCPAVIAAMIEADDIEPCDVLVSNQKRAKAGYRLKRDSHAQSA